MSDNVRAAAEARWQEEHRNHDPKEQAPQPLGYINRIMDIAHDDIRILKRKDAEYGGSWCKRGGVGAFMMLCRKWDRLEAALNPNAVKGDLREAPLSAVVEAPIPAYDILMAGEMDSRDEGILDDIGDLRRYLILVEAEILERRNKS
jgi:hypothetical protein